MTGEERANLLLQINRDIKSNPMVPGSVKRLPEIIASISLDMARLEREMEVLKNGR